MRVFRRPEDLFYPTGCSCLFDRRRLGRPFDPDYFLYAEDVYLGLRVRFAGWQVRHVPGSRVVHEGSATTRRRPAAAMTFYQERNRLLNLLLFFDGWFLVRIAPYLAANAALKLALALVRGRPSPRGLLRAYGWLARNGAVVREKRRSLRAERRVPAREVVRWMSAKVVHGDGPAGRLLNAASVGYCRIAGIGTYEIRGGRG